MSAEAEPISYRYERDTAVLLKERSETAPALLFPLETSVLELRVDGHKRRVDRSSFALVPARATYNVHATSAVAPTATLLLGPSAADSVKREYAPYFSDTTFAEIVAEPRLFPRTRWVDELVHRYLFERRVCEKHGSSAARFLETELTKELFFLGKEQLEQQTRASCIEEENELVRRARAWIEEHLFEPLRLAELARHCHASESTLLRAFRRELGAAPSEYVRSRRLEESLLLLQSGRYSVGEVATRVGYANLSAFTVAFRRRFGTPPSETRPSAAPTARLGPEGTRPVAARAQGIDGRSKAKRRRAR